MLVAGTAAGPIIGSCRRARHVSRSLGRQVMLPWTPNADESVPPQEAARPSRGRRVLSGSSVTAAHPPGWDQRPWTSRALHRVGEFTAHSSAGVLAAGILSAWIAVGVAAGFPTWWATALYSGAGSVTFLMVFVIQHMHERQTSAMQLKLDELIRSSVRADDSLIAVEEASDDLIQALTDINIAQGELLRE